MSRVLRVAGRELAAALRSPQGWLVAALVLALDGLLFNGYALGPTPRLSTEVLRDFFYVASGTTMLAAVLLSMRLLAEERQHNTLVLLRSSPLSEWELVLGKFLGGMGFLTLLTLATLYLPALILVHGRIALGHLAVGYLGLLLLGAAALAIGLFGSALADNQGLAALLSFAVLGVLLLAWWLARVTEPPVSQVLQEVALYNKHFVPFLGGRLRSRDIVYYGSVTYFFLLAAVHVEAARRWS